MQPWTVTDSKKTTKLPSLQIFMDLEACTVFAAAQTNLQSLVAL